MTVTINSIVSQAPAFSGSLTGGLKKLLEQTGRMPPVGLIIKPLDGSKPLPLDSFLSYKFQSSILVPVDSFDFSFVAPDDPQPLDKRIKEGDIISLFAAGRTLATGIIDVTDLEVDGEFEEKGQITGRDLMGQLEDQDSVSISDDPLWGNSETVTSGTQKLLKNTRISDGLILKDAPTSGGWLFGTEPGESKLASLQRFIEPMNCLAWMSPEGKLTIGRPNMAQKSLGRLFLSKAKRDSNVLSMKVTRASTSIPNVILPIWAGQETTQSRVSKEQRAYNAAEGPTRLRKAGHLVQKCVVISNPQATDPQGYSEVNAVKALGSNRLQAYAKRELARANIREMVVQAVVGGHYNESGDPYLADQVYKIEFDRGNVDEEMYLFAVEYELTAERAQITHLSFCRKGSIVSDVRIR